MEPLSVLSRAYECTAYTAPVCRAGPDKPCSALPGTARMVPAPEARAMVAQEAQVDVVAAVGAPVG